MSDFSCLIVDDEQDVCEILEFYLDSTTLFKNIVTASNGAEAMFKLKNQKFDLILLDCNMPKADGFDVVDDLGLSPIENVCVVSGDLDRSVVSEFIAKGVKNFVVKPFDQDTLVAKAKQLLAANLKKA